MSSLAAPSIVKILIAIGTSTLVVAGCDSEAKKPSETSPSASSNSATSVASPSSPIAGPTEHTTHQFFSGDLTVSYTTGWTIVEDSPGEFSISSPRDPDLRVIVWKDIFPTVPKHGLDRVAGIASTSQALLTWLRANPNLTIGKSESTTIGPSLPATAFDVSLAPNAVNDDPGCPERACVNFLGWPQWGEPYGLAGDAVTRFYIADTTQGTEPPLVVAAIEAVSATALKAELNEAQAIIASIKLPVVPA